MKVRILAYFLVLSVIITALPVQFNADTPGNITYWTDEGAYDISWFNNQSSEFLISTPEQLAGFMVLVENGNTFKDITIKLTANIDLSKYNSQSIGLSGTEFGGIFDGDGYHISGIANNEGPCEGLFWKTDSDAIIKNLGIDGEFGGNTCGGLVYENNGYITNCFNLGDVTGFGFGGGITGNNSGTIRNCANLGTISGEYYGGGIAGKNSGIIENCYNSGNINYTKNAAGGITGRNDNKVGCSYSTGEITEGEGVAFGGVIGSNNGEVYYDYYLKKTGVINEGLNSVGAVWNASANSGEGQDEKCRGNIEGTDSFSETVFRTNKPLIDTLNEATTTQNAVIHQYEGLIDELSLWKLQFNEYPVFINSRIPVHITKPFTLTNKIINDIIIEKSGILTLVGDITVDERVVITGGKNGNFVVTDGHLVNKGIIDNLTVINNSEITNCNKIKNVYLQEESELTNISISLTEEENKKTVATVGKVTLTGNSAFYNISGDVSTVNVESGKLFNQTSRGDDINSYTKHVAEIGEVNVFTGEIYNDATFNNYYMSGGSIENNGEIDYMNYTSGTIINRGTITKTDYSVLGDVNNNAKISAEDALLVLCSAVGKTILTETDYGFADVNGDGNVNAADALLILQYSVKKISCFPADINTSDYITNAERMNNLYNTELFHSNNKIMTVGEYKNILINVFGFDENYVNAKPPNDQDPPCESYDYFFPWSVDDDDCCSKDELIYYIVKTYYPMIVADFDSITEETSKYPGIYLAKKFCEANNIILIDNKNLNITEGDFIYLVNSVALYNLYDIMSSSCYLNNKYNTDLFTLSMEPVTTQYIKDILVEVFNMDEAYVDALPSEALPLPQESENNFFPWNLDSDMILPRGIVYYAAVKAFDPNVVADWSSITDDTGVYPGIRVAQNFCKNNGVAGSINRNDKINFADVAVLFAQLDKLYSGGI